MNAEKESAELRQIYSGFIRLHILHHAADDGIFGLGMIEELAGHGYKLSPGTLYPILHGMESSGLVGSDERCIAGKIRRVYRTTPAGETVLQAAKQRVRELFGELLESERVPQRARSKPRVVPAGAAAERRHRASKEVR